MKRFENKVAFVSGAASGIGQATAIRLASEGATLYIVDVNQAGLEETTKLCSEQGADVDQQICDVSNEEQVNGAIQACVDRFGKLDVLCNIAGILLLEHFEQTTVEQFHRIVNINLLGTFMLCKAAMPHLIESGGNIVNTSSTSAIGGAPYGAVYGASKGGVSALTRGIAVEFAKRGVRCNTVIPGQVDTNMTVGIAMPEDLDFGIMGRQGPVNGTTATPDMLASVIAMVASDDGAYMNGSEIRADGGGLS
jgi:NAD(P)-dependent dehydrogenase (short-subunit alcohol dehydrogenase family)